MDTPLQNRFMENAAKESIDNALKWKSFQMDKLLEKRTKKICISFVSCIIQGIDCQPPILFVLASNNVSLFLPNSILSNIHMPDERTSPSFILVHGIPYISLAFRC